MRLNLCCGDDIGDGYINIDVRKTKSSDDETNMTS
jgi:hypothetical protein